MLWSCLHYLSPNNLQKFSVVSGPLYVLFPNCSFLTAFLLRIFNIYLILGGPSRILVVPLEIVLDFCHLLLRDILFDMDIGCCNSI